VYNIQIPDFLTLIIFTNGDNGWKLFGDLIDATFE